MNRVSVLSLLAAVASTSRSIAASARTGSMSSSGNRREILRQKLPGEPLRETVLIEVTYPPGAGSPPHEHAAGATAFVVSGSIVSQLNSEPERTYHAGDAWYETPGTIHRISRNASRSESASLLAIYVAAPGTNLMRPLRSLRSES